MHNGGMKKKGMIKINRRRWGGGLLKLRGKCLEEREWKGNYKERLGKEN